jgi:hypothetical protein
MSASNSSSQKSKIVEVDPQQVYAYNLSMASSMKMSIATYFKNVNDLFYVPKEKEMRIENSNGDEKGSKNVLRTLRCVEHSLLINEQIDFIDYFLRIVKTPFEFCVNSEELIKYGVIKDTNNTSHVLKLLTQVHEFEPDIDFKISTETVNNDKRGKKYKKSYLMKPKVFKLCLMRSRNTNRYANYYLQLEDIYVFYQDYEKAYLNHILNGKDDKIDELKSDVRNLKDDIKEQNLKAEEYRQRAEEYQRKAEIDRQEAKERDRLNNEKFNKLLERTGATLDELEEIKEICQDTGIQIGEVVEAIDVINDKIDKTCKDNVRPALKNVEEKTEFVLIQSKMKPNEFKFLRGKKAYNDKTLRRMFDGDYSLIKREFDANPMTLFNEIKIYISDELKNAKKNLNTKGMDATQRQQARLALEKVKIKNIDIELCNGFTPDDFNVLIDRVIQEKFVVFEETIVLMDAKKGVVKNVIGKLTNAKK